MIMFNIVVNDCPFHNSQRFPVENYEMGSKYIEHFYSETIALMIPSIISGSPFLGRDHLLPL